MYIYIYIYIYVNTHVYIYIYIYIYLSLSLYIYIYVLFIYIHRYRCPPRWARSPEGSSRPAGCRRGTHGLSTNGVTANLVFLTEGLFGYSFQKCQGVPFSQSVEIHYFCSGPVSVDPICPQPTG